MEKTQAFLRDEQRAQLRKIAAKTGERQSALICRGVDLLIQENAQKANEWRHALSGVKGIWADRDDLQAHSADFRAQFSRRFPY